MGIASGVGAEFLLELAALERGEGDTMTAVEGSELEFTVGVGAAFDAGPPLAFDEVEELFVGGFGGHVVAEEAGGGPFPGGAVGEVPPGDRLYGGVTEEERVELRDVVAL